MDKRIILYIIAGLLIFGLLLVTFFPGKIQAWKDSGRDLEDKCSPKQGYTEQSWKEHMSHHPDVYSECLT